MPLYVYACQKCGETLERMQSFSADPLTECDECGGALRRVMQPVGIVFRGSGFYSTDHGRGSKGRDNDREGSRETASASSGSRSTTTSSSEKSSEKASSEKKEAGAGAATPVGSATSSS
ncbi:MAG TPA: FmdB family zinc ribbon protein [Chloroflexota bacterium]